MRGHLMSVTPLLSRAGCLLLSVVSTKAANMMLSEGMASQIFYDVVRRMTTYCVYCGFTSSTVPATGPRGAHDFVSLATPRFLDPPYYLTACALIHWHDRILRGTPSGQPPTPRSGCAEGARG